MSDPLREALSTQLKALPQSTPAMQAYWPLSFDRLALHEFQPFGVVDIAAASATTEWLFVYDRLDPTLHEVRAMFTGLVSWSPGDSILQLESLHYPSDMLNLIDEEWPQWMPISRVIAYRYLEPVSLRQAIADIVSGLSSSERKVIDAKTPDIIGMSADQVADRFLNPGTTWPATDVVLPIRSGTALGSGELSGTSNHLALRGRERAASTYYVNMAYHTRALFHGGFLPDPALSMVGGADSAPAREALLNATGPIIGSGRVRTVASAGAAFTSVRTAVQAASAADMVLITDTATYQPNSAIVIDKPIVITSMSTANALEGSGGLPTLRGTKPPGPRNNRAWKDGARQVILIRGELNGRPAFLGGIVQISNVNIEQGVGEQGGGIWVDACNQVLIDNVRFSENEAYGGGWLYEGFGGAVCVRHSGILVRRSAFSGNKSNCRGGALGVFGYGWPIVTDCRFESNRSQGLGVWNKIKPFAPRPDGGAVAMQMATPNVEPLYSELAVFIDDNPPPEPTGNDILDAANKVPYLALAKFTVSTACFKLITALGNGDIDSYWDANLLARSRRESVTIRRCVFKENASGDDGGALYATGLVRLRFRECEFEDNKAHSNGGGIRISTACEALLESCTLLRNESNTDKISYQCQFKKNKPSGEWNWVWVWDSVGGGAIAARTSNLKLVDVALRDNVARRFAGGAIFFTSTDEGPFQGFAGGKNDWNTVRNILVRDGTGPSPQFRQFTLTIEGCTIRDNATGWTESVPPTAPVPTRHCPDEPAGWRTEDDLHAKGGGIYALRYADRPVVFPPLSVVISAGTVLTGNVAAFSANATELFIADLGAPEGSQNPASDTGAVVRDAGGTLTAPYRFDATP